MAVPRRIELPSPDRQSGVLAVGRWNLKKRLLVGLADAPDSSQLRTSPLPGCAQIWELPGLRRIIGQSAKALLQQSKKGMDPSGIEPLTPGCKPGVLPLALQAHGPDARASGRCGGGDGTRTHTQDLMRVPVCQLIVPRNMGTAAWPSRKT